MDSSQLLYNFSIQEIKKAENILKDKAQSEKAKTFLNKSFKPKKQDEDSIKNQLEHENITKKLN